MPQHEVRCCRRTSFRDTARAHRSTTQQATRRRVPDACGAFRPACGLAVDHGRSALPYRADREWTFDQGQNLETSRDAVFIAAKIILLASFIVVMFALIAVYGLLARAAGRLGVAGFGLAIVGTMLLGDDLWFESFAVPWLAEGSGRRENASRSAWSAPGLMPKASERAAIDRVPAGTSDGTCVWPFTQPHSRNSGHFHQPLSASGPRFEPKCFR